MKSLILTGAIALGLSTAANAWELGNGLSIDNEITAERNLETDVNVFTWDLDASWDFGLGVVEVGPQTFDIENIEFTGMDYKITVPVKWVDGLEAYTETTTNDEWEIGDVTIGASFTF